VNFSPKIPVRKSNKNREYSRPEIKAALLVGTKYDIRTAHLSGSKKRAANFFVIIFKIWFLKILYYQGL
jgi:hypothetical protein